MSTGDEEEAEKADSQSGETNHDPETEADTASGGAAEPPDPA